MVSTLSWRPAHLPPTEHVEVEVSYGLATGTAAVGNHTVTVAERRFSCRKRTELEEQVAYKARVLTVKLSKRSDVLLRHKQHVHRCLRRNIPEGEYQVVLVHGRTGYLLVYDTAEEALGQAITSLVLEGNARIHAYWLEFYARVTKSSPGYCSRPTGGS